MGSYEFFNKTKRLGGIYYEGEDITDSSRIYSYGDSWLKKHDAFYQKLYDDKYNNEFPVAFYLSNVAAFMKKLNKQKDMEQEKERIKDWRKMNEFFMIRDRFLFFWREKHYPWTDTITITPSTDHATVYDYFHWDLYEREKDIMRQLKREFGYDGIFQEVKHEHFKHMFVREGNSHTVVYAYGCNKRNGETFMEYSVHKNSKLYESSFGIEPYITHVDLDILKEEVEKVEQCNRNARVMYNKEKRGVTLLKMIDLSSEDVCIIRYKNECYKIKKDKLYSIFQEEKEETTLK